MKGYIAAIDGLRAIAVIAVLLFHAFGLRGGYIGVDVFFVISGFIITRTYFDALVSGQERLRTFYFKRVRRLAPAYFVVLVATTIAAFVILPPPLLKNYGASLAGQPLYLQNFVFWSQGDYFDRVLTKPLLHTWSLGIEEQFYVLYGLLIMVGISFPRLLWPSLALAAIASYVFGHVVGPISPKTAFYWPIGRVWEFAVGVLAARFAFGGVASRWIGLAMIAAAIVAFNETDPFPGWQSLLACVGSVLVLCSTGRAAFLEKPVMVYIGRTSYSLYLWHWPIIALAVTALGRGLTWWEASAALLLTLGLSHLSAKYVEAPFRHGLLPPRRLVGAAAVASLATIGVAAYLLQSFGAVNRYPPQIAALYRAEQVRSPYRCSVWSRITEYPSEMCRVNNVEGQGGVLLIGDSHADQLDEMLGELGRARGVPVYLTVRNCQLEQYEGKGYCGGSVFDAIAREVKAKGITDVFAVSFLKPEVRADDLIPRVQALQTAGAVNVSILQPWPQGEPFAPQARIEALRGGRPVLPTPTLAAHEQAARPMRAMLAQVAERSGAVILDPAPYLCGGSVCRFEIDGAPLYFDTHHISPAGAETLRPMFAEALGGATTASAQP